MSNFDERSKSSKLHKHLCELLFTTHYCYNLNPWPLFHFVLNGRFNESHTGLDRTQSLFTVAASKHPNPPLSCPHFQITSFTHQPHTIPVPHGALYLSSTLRTTTVHAAAATAEAMERKKSCWQEVKMNGKWSEIELNSLSLPVARSSYSLATSHKLIPITLHGSNWKQPPRTEGHVCCVVTNSKRRGKGKGRNDKFPGSMIKCNKRGRESLSTATNARCNISPCTYVSLQLVGEVLTNSIICNLSAWTVPNSINWFIGDWPELTTIIPISLQTGGFSTVLLKTQYARHTESRDKEALANRIVHKRIQ